MAEISEKDREDKKNSHHPHNSFSLFPKIKQAAQKMAVLASHVYWLKQEMDVYKFQLKNVLSEW